MKTSTHLRPVLLFTVLSWGFFLLAARVAHSDIWNSSAPIRESTANSGLQLLVSAPPWAYVGEPVMTRIALKNTTKEDQFAPSSSPANDYSVAVIRLDGSKARYTLYGQERWAFPSVFRSLTKMGFMPGQVEKFEVDLSRIFDMSLPGDYKVHVFRNVWNPGTNTLVRLAAKASVVKIVPQKPAAVEIESEKDEHADGHIAVRATTSESSKTTQGAVNDGLSLDIRLENTAAEGDSPVELRVALRNSSGKPISLNSPQDEPGLLAQVIDSRGRSVAVTDLGKAAGGYPSIPLGNLILAPHTIVSTHLMLGAYYDISAEGKYWVYVKGNKHGGKAMQNLESAHLPLEVPNHFISAELSPRSDTYYGRK